MNQEPEDKKPQGEKLGNGYEYDCEPREFTDAAKAQWDKGLPPDFAAYKPPKKTA